MNNQDKSTFIYLDQDAASITEELKIEIIDKIAKEVGLKPFKVLLR